MPLSIDKAVGSSLNSRPDNVADTTGPALVVHVINPCGSSEGQWISKVEPSLLYTVGPCLKNKQDNQQKTNEHSHLKGKNLP